MFENLIASVKGERKLSMSHWRYRLLHWFFYISPAPKTAAESTLPKYFYTHYCPLFHLTNLIAIFSPIILAFRILVAVGGFVGGLVMAFAEWADNVRIRFCRWMEQKFPPKPRKPKVQPELTEAQIEWMKEKESRHIIRMMMDYNCKTFDDFWNDPDRYASIRLHNKEEAQALWDEYSIKIKSARERARAREEWMRKQILFWVNFSQVFVKCGLYVFYAALTALVAYLTVAYIIPALFYAGKGILWLLWELLSIDWLTFFGDTTQFLAYIGLRAIALGAVIFVLFKIGKRLVRHIRFKWMFDLIAPPFRLIGDIADAFARHVWAMMEGILQFFVMFYEENCPPITIVNDKEAALEDGDV